MDSDGENKVVIEELLDYLKRTRFEPLFLTDLLKDEKLSTGSKACIKEWLDYENDRVVLGHITFRRCGMRWNYEIRSVNSSALSVEEVLFWIKEDYPVGTRVSLTDRTFLSRLVEVYQTVIDDHLVYEGGLDREEVSKLRFSSNEDFFKYILWKFKSHKDLTRMVDRELIALLIDCIKQYEVKYALEN